MKLSKSLVLSTSFLASVLSCLPVLSQDIRIDPSGNKIVVFDDGTWRYYEPKDSIYEQPQTDLIEDITSEPVPRDLTPTEGTVYNYTLYKQYVVAAVAYEAEMVERVDEVRDKMLDLEDQIDALPKGDRKKELKAQHKQWKKETEDEQRLLVYSRNLIKKILKIGKSGDFHKLEKIHVPSVKVKSPPTRDTPPAEDSTTNTVVTTQSDAIHEGPAETEGDEVEITTDPAASEITPPLQTDPNLPDATDDRVTSATEPRSGRSATYIPVAPIRWSSVEVEKLEKPPCNFRFNGTDQLTQENRKQLTSQRLFTHTDAHLRNIVSGQEYLSCHGFLTSVSGGFRFLTLRIEIASKTATRDYGYLPSGSLLNIKLLNGQIISLFSQSQAAGKFNPRTGLTTYVARYPIGYQKEKLFLKSEWDEVRVVWSTGYEDYSVHNVDFFINQLGCLASK